MAQIPSIPTLDPVDKPYMNPREAGKPGAAISEAGDRGVDAAISGLDMLGHIREAQKNVDELAAQNELNAADEAYQVQLAKTTNSRDVEEVTKQHNDTLNSIANRWSNSPAVVEIQMHAESLIPRSDHLGQMKQIDLMGKEFDVQTTAQLKTLLPQLVTARRNGDKGTEDYINGYVNSIFDKGIKSGIVTDAQKQFGIAAFQEGMRKQLNESYITSADPKERQQAIAQLKSGGNGPLDLTGLAAGDVRAMSDHAEQVNEELNRRAESQSLNGDLGKMSALFSAPEYKDNYEAQIKSLQDGDWLKENGFVSEDGKPNFVRSEQLQQEVNRMRAERQKEQEDNDTKGLEKIEPLIIGNQMSRAKLVQVSQQIGLSPRAYNAALAKWDENNRYNHQVAVEGRQLADQERKEKSQEAAADWTLRIAQGAVPSDADIRTTPGLSKADTVEVTGYRDRAMKDKPYQGGMTIISSAYPQTSKMTPAQKGQQQEYYLRTMQAYDQEINAHPEEDKSVIASKLVMPGIVRNAILDSVPGYVAPRTAGIWERLSDTASRAQNFLEGKTPPAAQGGTIAPSSQLQTPKTIRVKEKSTGRMGTIPASEYDNKVYEKVQ